MTNESPSTTSNAARRRAVWPRIRQLSGLALLFFLGLHLVNVAAAAVDPGLFDVLLLVFKGLYRPDPIVEGMVVGLPFAVHLVASLVVALERWRDPEPAAPVMHAVRTSGTLLLLLVGLHVLVARVMPGSAGYSDTGAYESFGFENWPGLFIPYYATLAAVAVVHVAAGSAVALRQLGILDGTQARFQATVSTWVVILAVGVFLGLARLVYGASSADPTFYPAYKVLYDRCLPLMRARNPRER